jgi:hypothetical protein
VNSHSFSNDRVASRHQIRSALNFNEAEVATFKLLLKRIAYDLLASMEDCIASLCSSRKRQVWMITQRWNVNLSVSRSFKNGRILWSLDFGVVDVEADGFHVDGQLGK